MLNRRQGQSPTEQIQLMRLGDVQQAVSESMNKSMRMLVVPRKPLDENVFVDNFCQGTGPGPIVMITSYDRPVLITHIVWSVSATQALTVTIGDRIIQTSNNAALMTMNMDVRMVVYPKDVISIASGSGTPFMYLEIFGTPIDGVEWSRL